MASRTSFFSGHGGSKGNASSNASNRSNNSQDNQGTNTGPPTEEEIYNFNLIETQVLGSYMLIISNLFIILSSRQSEQLILSRFSPDINPEEIPNPTYAAYTATQISLFAAIMLTNLTLTRFNDLVNDFNQGKVNFSIQPNFLISIGSIFGLVASVLSMIGIQQILERDIETTTTQPVFL